MERDGREGSEPGLGERNPPRALLEALLVFAALWFRALLPGGGAGSGTTLADPAHHLGLLATLLPATALLLYLMVRAEGLSAFGVTALPKPRDLAGALVLLALTWLLQTLPGAVLTLLPDSLSWADLPVNPLLAGLGRPEAPPSLLIPLLLLSSLATGYGEELFFRVYLLRRLGQAGLGVSASVVASSLLFGACHGSQGPLAALVAGLLGAVLALRWLSRRSWHEIALGHGLYDLSALLLLFYAPR